VTARDELATHARAVLKDYGAVGTVRGEAGGEVSWGDALFVEESDCPESIADAVVAAGWRKMPSRDELVNAMVGSDALAADTRAEAMQSGSTQREPFLMFADAVLALVKGSDG
jgi:hypothetical protein